MRVLNNLLISCLLLSALESCSLFGDSDNALTIVKGTVTDIQSGKAVSGIPVEILKCADGLELQGPMCDSLSVVWTNANGEYETRFFTERGYYYRIGVRFSERYNGTDPFGKGQVIEEGRVNIFDFEQTRFRILQVRIETSKHSKNYLEIGRVTIASSVDWLGGTVLMDTSRLKQVIDTIVYVKVYPFSTYQLNKSLCFRDGVEVPRDCEYMNFPPVVITDSDTTLTNVN